MFHSNLRPSTFFLLRISGLPSSTRTATLFPYTPLFRSVDDARRGWFSPSLAGDLAGLPPAYIATGSLDLFFDENLDYARRLVAAGVSVDLHSYAGAIHAFNAIPDAALSQRFNEIGRASCRERVCQYV